MYYIECYMVYIQQSMYVRIENVLGRTLYGIYTTKYMYLYHGKFV